MPSTSGINQNRKDLDKQIQKVSSISIMLFKTFKAKKINDF